MTWRFCSKHCVTLAWVILPEFHGTNAQFNMVLHLILFVVRYHRSQIFLSDHQISVFFYNFATTCRSYEKILASKMSKKRLKKNSERLTATNTWYEELENFEISPCTPLAQTVIASEDDIDSFR